MYGRETSGFIISFEENRGYLHATVSGAEDSMAVSKAVFKSIGLKAQELNVKRVLIEENFSNQISTLEMFQLAEYVVGLFPGTMRIAHLDRNLADIELNRFGETVAVNRGAQGKVFSTFEEAERWLTSERDVPQAKTVSDAI